MPSVIYNISLWRATTVKHRRVDTSLPWSAETRQNDNGERGARPLRARINLLSSRISCCCGLDATHKGGKEEEEGFRCWPFFFLSSLFAVCHKTFFFGGGAFDGVRRDTKSRGLYFCSSSSWFFSSNQNEIEKSLPIGFQFDLLDANETKSDDDGSRFLRNVFNYKPSGFFLPSLFSFLFFFIPDQLIIW